MALQKNYNNSSTTIVFGFFFWLIFIPLAVHIQDIISGIPSWVLKLGAYGLLISSILTTALLSGRAGLNELLSRGTHFLNNYIRLLSLISPVLLYLITVSLSGVMFNGWSSPAQYELIAEMAGRYPGKRPIKNCLMALSQILLLAFFAVIVLTETGMVFVQLFKASRVAIWFITGFLFWDRFPLYPLPALKESVSRGLLRS